MRPSIHPSLRIAFLAGVLLGAAPTLTLAQEAVPSVSPATPPSAPVDAPLLEASLSPVLVIPAPPEGKLRVEMDARSEDILGLMKSFLKGIGETAPAKTPGQTVPVPNPVADLLANGNLADILKDVNHVHFVVYELTPPTPPAVPEAVPPAAKNGVKPMPMVTMPPVMTPPAPTFDSNAFYESAFASEGAHRIMFADADAYKLLMVGFPDRKGFAFAVSGAGYIAVERADGYPNLEILSAFISRATVAVMNSKTGKDLMHLPLNNIKGDDKKELVVRRQKA